MKLSDVKRFSAYVRTQRICNRIMVIRVREIPREDCNDTRSPNLEQIQVQPQTSILLLFKFRREPQTIAKPWMTYTDEARVASSNVTRHHRLLARETSGRKLGTLASYRQARAILPNFETLDLRVAGQRAAHDIYAIRIRELRQDYVAFLRMICICYYLDFEEFPRVRWTKRRQSGISYICVENGRIYRGTSRQGSRSSRASSTTTKSRIPSSASGVPVAEVENEQSYKEN